MTSLDFALKDLYRKRHSNFPFLLIIILTIAFSEFLIYFTSSLGLNIFIQTSFANNYYFSGGINLFYIQFNNLVQILLISLAVIIVVIDSTTLVLSKKRDIAIMKSLGTLPRKLYNFYLLYIVIGLSFLSIGISKALFEDPTVESNLYFIAAIFFLFLGESYCNLIYNKIIRKEILKL